MNYFLLADTEFFRRINEAGDCNMETAYNGFRQPSNRTVRQHPCEHTAIALAYIEIELQHHPVSSVIRRTQGSQPPISERHSLCVRKMQKFLTTPQVPPLSNLHSSAETPSDNPAPPLQWTGNAIDLVELIYGIYEMGCINNGEMPLKQLAPLLYRIFGVEAKDCYRFYTDIKRRKTISHTHFSNKCRRG